MIALFEYQSTLLARAADDIAGNLATVAVRLTKMPVTIAPTNALADFVAVEADFHGYAAKAVTWGTPGVASDGNVEVIGTISAFRPTDAVVPNSIYTVFICVVAVPDVLAFAGQLESAPVAMGDVTDELTLIVRYRPASGSLLVQVD